MEKGGEWLRSLERSWLMERGYDKLESECYMMGRSSFFML